VLHQLTRHLLVVPTRRWPLIREVTVFIDTLRASVDACALTINGLRSITELDFRLIPERGDIPHFSGVYGWAQDEASGVWYLGSGSGSNGLSSRLGVWFAAVAGASADNRDPLLAPSIARWSPAIRAVVEHKLRCYAAVVPDDPGAKVWEARMQQASRIVTGNVSLLGGSAWELKGPLAFEADAWAWERLCEMEQKAGLGGAQDGGAAG
jgi:hypothetical protein